MPNKPLEENPLDDGTEQLLIYGTILVVTALMTFYAIDVFMSMRP